MTPLILLVGFLGSGKTTFLRRLLPEIAARGGEPHVIINDYQNARVDAELVRDLAGSVVPISGSCVCCGSRDELLSALGEFEHRPGRAVVIETNGTTDSEELIEMLALEPTLAKFTPPLQLSILDGQRWQKRFWHNSLEVEQARTASFFYFSRWEGLDEARRGKVRDSLARHGLRAERVDPAGFAEIVQSLLSGEWELPSRQSEPHPEGCGCGHDHSETSDPANHAEHHFASLQISLPDVVAQRAMEAFLESLPREVLRVKGLARLEKSPEEYHVFQRVEDAPTQWFPVGKTTRFAHPVAVLIGPGIEPSAIREMAAAVFGGA